MERNAGKYGEVRMMKVISEEYEVCDICQKEKVARYYHGGAVTCDWCGKVMCKNCYQTIFTDPVCPDCLDSKFRTYMMLLRKRDSILVTLDNVEKDVESEVKELKSLKVKTN